MSSESAHPRTTTAPATPTAQWRDYFFRCLEHLIQTTADERIRLQATLGGLRALAQIDAISQRNLRLAQHQDALDLARAHHQRMGERHQVRLSDRDHERISARDTHGERARDVAVSTPNPSPSPTDRERTSDLDPLPADPTPAPHVEDHRAGPIDPSSDSTPPRQHHPDDRAAHTPSAAPSASPHSASSPPRAPSPLAPIRAILHAAHHHQTPSPALEEAPFGHANPKAHTSASPDPPHAVIRGTSTSPPSAAPPTEPTCPATDDTSARSVASTAPG